MTCKIERLITEESKTVLRVSGRITAEHMITIKELVEREDGGVALDLVEVTLVDGDSVNLLASLERKGIEIRNCPAFLREWLANKRQRMAGSSPDAEI